MLNRDVAPYVCSLDQLHVFPWTAECLHRLHTAGFDIFVVSNQQGVALGLTPPEVLEAVTETIQGHVRPLGFEVVKFYYCTAHDGQQHPWRKPNPGMIHAAAEEFGVSLEGAFLVGDWWKDIAAARAAGLRPVLVSSGVSRAEDWIGWEAQPEVVVPSLIEAVDYVLANA